MKRIILLSIVSLLFLSSCYDEYVKDYDFSAVYFANQANTRTVVVGEGLKIEVGVVLAGVIANKQDRVIEYTWDNSLVTSDILAALKSGSSYIKEAVKGVEVLQPMPKDFVTLSDDSRIIIPKGDHLGKITVKVDSAKFLSDVSTLKAKYALPIKIVSADADSIPESMRTTVIGLHYENMLFGHYWHGGVTEVRDASGKVIDRIEYPTAIPQPENNVWTLTTTAPFSLESNTLGNGSVKGSMKLTLQPDGNILIEKADKSAVNVTADGECRFNQASLLQERKIFLKYKFENGDGTTSHATDTLTFRNRIRDGVNEWQDENPDHYSL